MTEKVKTFSKEIRVEQLKKCCESIIDNAEKIVEGYDLQHSFSVTIDFPCREFPMVSVINNFISKKMLDVDID